MLALDRTAHYSDPALRLRLRSQQWRDDAQYQRGREPVGAGACKDEAYKVVVGEHIDELVEEKCGRNM